MKSQNTIVKVSLIERKETLQNKENKSNKFTLFSALDFKSLNLDILYTFL